MRKIFLFIALLPFFLLQSVFSTEISCNSAPLIGAQVIIEHGQSAEEIDALFATLQKSNMTVCRIRMFEAYMHDGNGNWNFAEFDEAFRAAERHHIKVLATLFPMVEFTNIGGFKFPDSETHLASVANYIAHVVPHFSNYKSFAGWVLMNEIGSGRAPFGKPLTDAKFTEWKNRDIVKSFDANGRPIMPFYEERFLVDYNTWYLQWLKSEVRKYDSNSHLHVNTHAIFDTYGEYNFTKWRGILDSFGGSAHASWHFGNFTRNNYHYAMAANSEILRSGAGNKPWLMTELQGGNNIWSGGNPMCPTAREIEQWMWTVIGTGGKGLIFWSLNGRTAGIEAGEWALLDLQNKPTERMEAAAKIAKVVQQHADFLSIAKVAESGVNILYTRESLWAERRAETVGATYAGRKPGAAMKSVIGFYEAFGQLGIQANIKCVDEFDFTTTDNRGKVIVLAHQIALSAEYATKLETFVKSGGLLVVEGLTGFYNQHMQLQLSVNNPFLAVLGGNLKDVKMHANQPYLRFQNLKSTLPVHWWQGTIDSKESKAISENSDGHILATVNELGHGKVIWLPSLVAIEAHETQNFEPLMQFVSEFISPVLFENVLTFAKPYKGLLMQQLENGGKKLIVLINKSDKNQSVRFNKSPLSFISVFSEPQKVFRNTIKIQPEETLVLELSNP